ncbi:HAD hydrolase-like protein [Bacteroides fragilis]|uniref:HAD hydrolase-like protein n=1 Tax=Bacteroides fragilis TaxID=817 RepID=A0ABD4VT57_BACFG|nr:HAD hydrolase-like protein [Bacteroides fragilis]MCE8540442.1 HAD hydrolase-like protein [Bacteroides fragilis]MCE8641883.1 HAD hydrolase-like protein [Bacteroides fragilis]MCM0325842.1 HAD hydrolase-like protein [Bacteroides fragilis]MCZ2654697.1 HAD hydrolase-like protein [Bacteroides fragilis]WMI95738.1 HAD-IA family hydrolase [Bacteroides fragilis]
MKYRLAIFDLDGTLLDTTEGIVKSVVHTIRYFNLPLLPQEVLLSFIGPPIQDSFAKFYGLSGDILQEIATIFRNDYSNNNLLKAKPYDGIYQLFRLLSDAGIQTAVATYKREDYAVALLNHFGFNEYTKIMYGGDHDNKLRKKDIIQKCIDTSNVGDNGCIVMVGDTLHDAVGAEGLGIDFIAVTYGFGFKADEVDNSGYVGYADKAIDVFNLMM